MSLLQAFVLGVIQGATEFLPVSSSGHLVLVPWVLGWPAPGLAFDTVVHWGTALGVVAYFRRDWIAVCGAAVRAAIASLRERSLGPWRAADARLAGCILLGTVPAAAIGYLLDEFFEGMFARPRAAAALLLVTALLLAVSERLGRRERDLDTLTWLDAVLIGFGQALAIFPGISRSGATIAAGMGRGLRRTAAARFSFLLATPIIFGAGLFKLLDLAQEGALRAQVTVLLVGLVAAATVGSVCIHFLLRFLRRHPLYLFAAYCAVIGIVGLLLSLVN